MRHRHLRANGSRRAGVPRRHLTLRPEPLERRDLLSAGQPDTSFGNAGLATAQVAGLNTNANAVAIQANGEIVTAGGNNTSTGAQNFAVARFTTAGALDTSFGNGGTVSTAIGKGTSSVASDVAVQPDGKIIAAGTAVSGRFTYTYSFALARYNSNGTLDGTFGNRGEVTTAFGNSQAQAMALYPNSASDPADSGKILVAGYSSTTAHTLALARYNSNGTLDTSFGNRGTVLASLAGFWTVNEVALEPNGAVVVAANVHDAANNQEFKLIKYTEKGALDTSFGGTGVVTTQLDTQVLPNGHYDSESTSLVIQTNGQIVAGGSVRQPLTPTPTGGSGSIPVLGLARYNADGSLDTSFGNGGTVVDNVSAAFNGSTWNAQFLNGLTLDANANLVFGGELASTTVVNGKSSTTYYGMVGRFTSQGALDSTFGNGGLTFAPQALQNADWSHDLAIYPSPDAGDPADAGKIVLAGNHFTSSRAEQVGVARYLSDPVSTNALSASILASPTTSSGGGSPSVAPAINASPSAATDAALATLDYPLIDERTLSQLASGRK